MKLVLIRHGKSDWHAQSDDFNRPLNKRGNRDAFSMACKLKDMGIIPDMILSSPAVRTYASAELMAEVFGSSFDSGTIIAIPELYLASQEQIMECVESCVCDDEASKWEKTIFLFGHNPGISKAASCLKGQEISMPTCGVAVFDIERKNGELTVMNSWDIKPKDLKTSHAPG